ncbi:RluA family pseudouridine synthase [Variovorax humicola]|uniref:RluA family pseudouridine synthase n=1 Tax=Variovorax humicola TaxID=1769758 RepID=A0ABU8W4K9_9BURK
MMPPVHEAPAVRAIHEDAHLLVLDKPAGLLCVPGRGADKQDCLSTRARMWWPDALVVHRLDMSTSGLVLMARSPAMQRALGDAFAMRLVDKRYEAVVDGLMPVSEEWAVIDAPLIADWPRRPLQKIDPEGKPSQTRWRALRQLPHDHATHVLLEPLTGRSHQLRVHLASIGHAILGDALYASDAARRRAPRLMLHATSLAFMHPATMLPMRFESPAPFVEVALRS